MAEGKPLAIVTGGNRGIGKEIARQLTAKGYRVIIGVRDPEKGAEAATETGAEFLTLDMANEKSILQFAEKVKTDFGKVKVLVNNAGILDKADNRLLDVSAEIISQTLNTNSIGPLLLTRAMASNMIAGASVINISSGGGSMTDPVGGWAPAYCISKTLLNAITRQLASELQSKNITVNSVCPGWVKTDMGGKNAPRTVAQGADTAVWLATDPHAATGKFYRDRKEISF